MEQNTQEQLSLLGDSHANHLVLPGSEEARQMTVSSGLKCSGLYQKQGPLGFVVRMLLESSGWISSKCFLTWRGFNIKSKYLIFQLVPVMPRTGGKGSGLLPTPRAMMGTTLACKTAEISHLAWNLEDALGMNPYPNYVEWMMGYPQNWTDLEASGMQ